MASSVSGLIQSHVLSAVKAVASPAPTPTPAPSPSPSPVASPGLAPPEPSSSSRSPLTPSQHPPRDAPPPPSTPSLVTSQSQSLLSSSPELRVDLSALTGPVTALASRSNWAVIGDANGLIHCLDFVNKSSRTYRTNRGAIKRIHFGPFGCEEALVQFKNGEFGIWDFRQSLRRSISSYLKIRDIRSLDVDWISPSLPVIACSDGAIRMMDRTLSISNSKATSEMMKILQNPAAFRQFLSRPLPSSSLSSSLTSSLPNLPSLTSPSPSCSTPRIFETDLLSVNYPSSSASSTFSSSQVDLLSSFTDVQNPAVLSSTLLPMTNESNGNAKADPLDLFSPFDDTPARSPELFDSGPLSSALTPSPYTSLLDTPPIQPPSTSTPLISSLSFSENPLPSASNSSSPLSSTPSPPPSPLQSLLPSYVPCSPLLLPRSLSLSLKSAMLHPSLFSSSLPNDPFTSSSSLPSPSSLSHEPDKVIQIASVILRILCEREESRNQSVYRPPFVNYLSKFLGYDFTSTESAEQSSNILKFPKFRVDGSLEGVPDIASTAFLVSKYYGNEFEMKFWALVCVTLDEVRVIYLFFSCNSL